MAIEASVVEHLCYLCDSVCINTAYSNAHERSAKRSISFKHFFHNDFVPKFKIETSFC